LKRKEKSAKYLVTNISTKSNEAEMNIANFIPKIKDNRKARGKRYNIMPIVRIIVGGLLCGANNLASIHRWATRLTDKKLRALGFWRGNLLCYSNLTLVVRKIDPDSLCEAMVGMINNLGKANKNYRVFHIDGKFLNNSNCFGDKTYSHILTAFNEHFRSTYAYQKIEGRNEFEAMIKLLKKHNFKGKIITADAAFVHQEVLDTIASKGADFAITIKGNEPNLLEYTKQAFAKADPAKISAFSEDVDYMHGRIEQRSIEVIDMPYEYLNGHRHIKQLCRITRHREQKNKPGTKSRAI
jgi:predicted transposase YbfD/YdcC